MAIIIPSKNIYDKNNNIIINNQIDKVEISANNAEIITDTTNIYNENITVTKSNLETGSNQIDSDGRGVNSGSTSVADFSIYSYVNLIPSYVEKTFTIPKTSQNSFISSILTGKDENGNTNIQYSLIGDIITGTTNQNITIITMSGLGVPTYYIDSFNIHYYPQTTEKNKSYTLSKDKTEVENTVQYTQGAITLTATASVVLQSEDNIATATVIDNDENYQINLKFLAGLTIIKAGGNYNTFSSSYPNNTPVNLYGTYEQYIPTQINVSLYGITIKLNLNENTVVIGNGKKSFSINSNELIQDTNTYNSTENAVEKIANTILTKYTNGLQNATVLCSISDYYDENGNIIITKDGSKDMVFRMHDEVIPYVYSANGTDIPMALKQDGSPKVFRVIGTKIYYDGAVWQELTLKEIADN